MNGASESSGRKTQLNTRRLFGIGFIIFGLLAGTVFIVAIISQPNRQMMSDSAILRQSQQPILPSADSLALSASEAIGFQSNVSSNEAELRVSQLQLTNTPLETQAQSGNHTACMAQVITLPATIVQSSDNAFNIYRFDATAQSYDVSVSDYASTGQVLVYQILTDNCRTLQSMSVRFQAMADISPTQPLESIFEDIFIPGTAYLLAIHTTGMTAARPYTLTIGAVIPSKPDTMMGISHPVNLVRTFMPIVVTSNLTLPRTHGVTQNIVPLPQAIVAPPQSEPQAPKPPKHEPKKPKEHKVKESKPKKH